VPLPEEVSDPKGVADDLLAGLPADGSETAPTGLDADLLRADLAARRAYLAVCEGYLNNVVSPGFAQALQQYAEQEQEIIYLLARALRQAGEPTAEIAADPEPIARGAGLETIGDRQAFLLEGVRRAQAGWQACAAASRVPGVEEQALWEGLLAQADAQVETLTTPQR
jgi:hypothetical protein